MKMEPLWSYRQLPSALMLLMATTAPFAAEPICSSAAADQDGDGWGWENNASCIVQADVTNSTTANPVTTDTSALQTVPACSSSALDPDGDGWGWENHNSCMVIPGVSATDDHSTVSVAIEDGPTICASPASDIDGDGWGWENNGSCVVVTSSSGSSTPAVMEPTSVPVVPAAVPVLVPGITRIMAVGDSITHGVRGVSAASYRKSFTEMLDANSCQFQMTGSQTGNFNHNTFVSPHEGYGGHRADHILYGHNDDAGNNEGISVTVDRYQPHVVLLHIGSNDMKGNQSVSETIGEIDQIISIALAADSTPTVLVANLIPWLGDASVEVRVALLGDQLEAYVAQLSNPRVKIVDVRTGFRPSMMLVDLIHPNSAGENHIADRFFAVYNDSGFCR